MTPPDDDDLRVPTPILPDEVHEAIEEVYRHAEEVGGEAVTLAPIECPRCERPLGAVVLHRETIESELEELNRRLTEDLGSFLCVPCRN